MLVLVAFMCGKMSFIAQFSRIKQNYLLLLDDFCKNDKIV